MKKDGDKHIYCFCKCSCGKMKLVVKNHLLHGISASCGCCCHVCADRTKPNRNNRSGFRGIWEHRGKWKAKISVNGKGILLGIYGTPEEAHRAYLIAKEKYFSEKIALKKEILNAYHSQIANL